MTYRSDDPGPRTRAFAAIDALRRYVDEAPHLSYEELWALVQVELDMESKEAKIIRKSVESMLDIGLFYQEP